MILLSLLVLIPLRPIPAYQKSNVLSGITGNWMLFPLIEMYLFFFYFLLMMQNIYELLLFVQSYVYYSFNFHNNYVIIHGVLLKFIF